MSIPSFKIWKCSIEKFHLQGSSKRSRQEGLKCRDDTYEGDGTQHEVYQLIPCNNNNVLESCQSSEIQFTNFLYICFLLLSVFHLHGYMYKFRAERAGFVSRSKACNKTDSSMLKYVSSVRPCLRWPCGQ